MSNFLLQKPEAVFIHIPKTGGYTIRKGIWGSRYDGPYTGEWKDEWDDLFSFAFVRHPLDRFVSAYNMFTNGTNVKRSPRNIGMGIDMFATKTMYDNDAHVTQSIKHHTIPMTNPINFIHKAKHIGRYERFEADLEAIKKELGINDSWIPTYNVSQKYGNWNKIIKEEMSTDILESLIEFYREDFKEFNYDIPRVENF